MQQSICELLRLGQLPDSASADVSMIRALEEQLAKVQTPITDDEACALLTLFGADDCFGLAWTLLHLIETAPGWPVRDALDSMQGEWARRLRERAE